jgi:hypothetical protein
VSGRTELADRPQGAERAVEMPEHGIGRRPGIVCDHGARSARIASDDSSAPRGWEARPRDVLDLVTQMSAGSG